MNTQSTEEPLTFKSPDLKSAAANFCMFAQAPNDSALLNRFLKEKFTIEPVWMDKDGTINTEGKGRMGARFTIVINERDDSEEPKKKSAKKVTESNA